MRILGVDPGLKATGYGLVESNGEVVVAVEVGVIAPNKKDSLQNRITKVYTILAELIREYNPNILVIEKLFAHYKHPATAITLGHVRGVIYLLCSQMDIKLAEYSAKRIRKAVTGNGSASKLQTKKVVAYTFNLDEETLTLDAGDALAMALGYIRINCCDRI